MGMEQSMLKNRHIFPPKRVILVFCSLSFFMSITAAIAKAVMSIKSAMPKSQNRIITGALSTNGTSQFMSALFYHRKTEKTRTGTAV